MSTRSEVDSHVGAALRRARLARGLRQDDLAEQLGVDRSTIARYENGTRSMSVDTLMYVAHVLGRPATCFLPGIFANEGVSTVLQALERRPDLLPRVVAVLQVSLQDDGEETEVAQNNSRVADWQR
jgi:transcriptional regulator with XRE-family HTH domain